MWGNGDYDVTLTDVTASHNGEDGVELQLTYNPVVHLTNITADDNTLDGVNIAAEHGSEVTLKGIATSDNGDDGVHLGFIDDSWFGLTDAISERDPYGLYVFLADAAMGEVSTFSALDSGRGLIVDATSGTTLTGSDVEITRSDATALELRCRGATVDLEGVEVSDSSTGVEITQEEDCVVALSELISTGHEDRGLDLSSRDASADSLLTVTRSTVRDNGADDSDGGGIFLDAASNMAVVIDSTTVSGNRAETGGGLFAELGPSSALTIVNSTFSGNQDTGGIPGLAVVDAELSGDVVVDIRHSTFTDNSSTAAESSAVDFASIEPQLHHTIVADNPTSVDLTAELGDGTSSSFNLVDNVSQVTSFALTSGTGTSSAVRRT